MFKVLCVTQKVVALSSGEAEYYGLVKSGSQGLGIRALWGDLGVERTVTLNTDASAAIGMRHAVVSVRFGISRGLPVVAST